MKKIALLVLTASLLSLGSCGNSKERDIKIDTVTNEVIHQNISTVDFHANGSENSWQLSVTFDGKIVFTDSENKVSFISEENDIQVASGADIVNITAENETHVIRVNIDIADCEKSGKQVNIMLRKISEKNGADYTGCGFYRGKPQLHDIWALKSINGNEVSAEQFPKELPHFEFNLVTKKMSGFAGCNQVNGDLKFGYNKMIIEPLSSTRMYCGETSKLEEEILSILKSETTYDHRGLSLTIESIKGSIVLKKVD